MIVRLIAVLAFAALAACETIEGFGEDVETGGEAIQQTSREVQSEL